MKRFSYIKSLIAISVLLFSVSGLFAQQGDPVSLVAEEIFYFDEYSREVQIDFSQFGDIPLINMEGFGYASSSKFGEKLYRVFDHLDACTEDSVFMDIYENGVVTVWGDIEVRTYYFYDFLEFDNGLKPGMTREEVKEILGTPVYEDDVVMAYADRFEEPEEYSWDSEDPSIYEDPVHLYFYDGKLYGIRVTSYGYC